MPPPMTRNPTTRMCEGCGQLWSSARFLDPTVDTSCAPAEDASCVSQKHRPCRCLSVPRTRSSRRPERSNDLPAIGGPT